MGDTCILHMLHTNDVHSRFSSMPRIATCLRTHRTQWEQRKEHVLTLDIGDHLDRMSMITEASFGKANVEIMNQSGYQYATIGNNEGITLTKPRLGELYKDAAFTVIAGNLLDGVDGKVPKWAVPYAIHRWSDLRVALLAMTIPYPHSYQSLGWEARGVLPLLAEQIAALRSQADIVVLMSHLGYQEDCRLAEQLDGLDVILGAHTHHLLENGVRIGNTLIAQTGRFGQYVGHVRLVWDRTAGQITEATAEVFASESYQQAEDIVDIIREEEKKAEELLSRPLAVLGTDLWMNWEQETPFASFLAASIREKTNAEIGLANGGLLLTDLTQGIVTSADLLRCVPHPLNLCAVTLTGEQLMQILEQAIQPEIITKRLYGCGFRGQIEGWMGVDGLQIQYIPAERPNILSVEVNGQPLVSSREYRVGTVDMFMYNRLFPTLLQGRDIQFFLPAMLREILAETLHHSLLLDRAFVPRWIPVETG